MDEENELMSTEEVARFLRPDKPLTLGAVWKEMNRAKIRSVRGYPAAMVRAYKTSKRKGKGYRSDLLSERLED